MTETITGAGDVFLKKQVQPLFKATLSGGLFNIAAAVLVFSLLLGTTHKDQALWLSVVIVVLSIVRILVSNDYLTKHRYRLKNYLKAHTVLTLFVGISWAFYIYMLHAPEDEAVRNIIFLINFGLIAGSITTLSSYKVAYLSFMLPQFVAIFVVFVIIDTPMSDYIALAVFLSAIFMMAASFSINKIHKKEIKASLYNKKLIRDLHEEIKMRRSAQQELEKSKHDLELKVQERTSDLVEINASLERVIDKKEEAEQTLQYLAYHDELTGLPNRNTLVDRIGQSIKKCSREQQRMGILFLDLDRFKNVNDSLGHTVGDELIQQVSARLHSTLRNNDTISRNGGDEFVVVVEELGDTNEVIHVAKKIISCLTETFEIQSHKIHLGVSVGISIYPSDGETPLVLLRNADTAMYRAKIAGGNQLQFYDESMSRQLRDRLELEHELHTALFDEEFYLEFQPQISCITGITTGFEALMRWNNKNHGLVPPARFVPLLEETGLIYSVGEWVVSQVIEFIREHRINNITVSINLSALQCNDLEFVSHVRKRITESGIDPSLLEFEITESLLINDFDKTKLLLDEMHSIGCTIALDDFGTGYTSMNYLARLPIDIIKVDQTLVRDIDVNNNLRSIVTAIVTMSNGLGIRNIFEGVETMAELGTIKKMGGEIIQGYLFSKPLSEYDAARWLDSGDSARQA